MSVTIKDLDGNTLHLTQWETDRVMLISGTEDMPICRFASRFVKQALVVNGEAVTLEDPSDDPLWTVKIPNFLLEFDGIIGVAVMAETDAGEVREIAMTNLKVIPRQKPQDYCYSDNIGYINWVTKAGEVQDLIDDIQEMLDNGDLKGDKGDPGDPGPAGQDGAPGQDGADGAGVPASGTTGQYLRKKSGTDYDTEWATMPTSPTEVFWATYGTTTNADIEAAYQAGKICACIYNGYTYYLVERGDAAEHVFSCVDSSYVRVVYNTSGTWGHDEFDIVPMIPVAYTSNPAALGTASPGSSTKYAKGDHVHPKPTPADIGAGTYSKPSGGIPSTDLASAVQTSLGKADSAYQKPSGGIPATDLANGVIPSVPSAATATPANLGTAAVGTSTKYAREDHIHNKPSYTASEVGAIAAPSSPASGAFLVWNGSAWVAQTLSTWQASSY